MKDVEVAYANLVERNRKNVSEFARKMEELSSLNDKLEKVQGYKSNMSESFSSLNPSLSDIDIKYHTDLSLIAGVAIPKLGEMAESSGILPRGSSGDMIVKTANVVNIISSILGIASLVVGSTNRKLINNSTFLPKKE